MKCHKAELSTDQVGGSAQATELFLPATVSVIRGGYVCKEQSYTRTEAIFLAYR